MGRNLLDAMLAATILIQVVDGRRSPNTKLFTGQRCAVREDCNGTDVFCNEFNLCECQLGYLPQTLEALRSCMPYECDSLNDCECSQLYGSSTEYNATARECRTNVTKLYEKCFEPKQCGHGATCDENNTCQCIIGNIKVNDYVCGRHSCRNTQDCESVMLNTVCTPFGEDGFCFCKGDFMPNPRRTQCTRHGADRGAKCTNMLDCSRNATCSGGACTCLQGYIASRVNTIDCTKIECTADADCRQYDINSVCDTLKKDCTCKPNYYTTSSDETCQSFSDNLTWLYIYIFAATASGCVGALLAFRYLVNKHNSNGAM